MRTISRILFIFIIAFIGVIFIAGQNLDLLVFKYRQNVIRKEIKNQIKSGVAEKDLIQFQAKNIFLANAEWIKPGKEFKLNGEMYDVVKTEFQNGEFMLKCISDKQESKLFAELDELVKKRINGNTDEEKKNLTKDFLKIFFETENIILISFVSMTSSFFLDSFLPSYFSITSPPPQNLI